MEFSNVSSDDRVLAEVAKRLTAARLARDRTQSALARDAGVSKRTVERMETGQSVQLTSFLRVLRALDLLDRLDALLPSARPAPIELLETGGRPRQRASGSRAESAPPDEPWRWGEGEDA